MRSNFAWKENSSCSDTTIGSQQEQLSFSHKIAQSKTRCDDQNIIHYSSPSRLGGVSPSAFYFLLDKIWAIECRVSCSIEKIWTSQWQAKSIQGLESPGLSLSFCILLLDGQILSDWMSSSIKKFWHRNGMQKAFVHYELFIWQIFIAASALKDSMGRAWKPQWYAKLHMTVHWANLLSTLARNTQGLFSTRHSWTRSWTRNLPTSIRATISSILCRPSSSSTSRSESFLSELSELPERPSPLRGSPSAC